MKISFIGAGNVAWHLAQAFEAAGHLIGEVYSRDPQRARQLTARLYDTAVRPDLNFSESHADLILIAVADDALEAIMQRVVLPEGVLLANVSGSRSLDDLRRLAEAHSNVPVRTGVLYPLQTFSLETSVDYAEIPFCVEASDQTSEAELLRLAGTLGGPVQLADSEERRRLHLAAVFACNFTNHLWTIAHELLAHEKLSFELLGPLIRQTARKALESGDPATGQTGPARRCDWATTARHLEDLQALNPEWATLYRLLTEAIMMRHFGAK